MTTPHDDELRSALSDAPDHRPDFWATLDADLGAEERENVVPLATTGSARPRGRGLLLAAAVLAVLGGIGAWFAFGGDDDGPNVAVDPDPSVTTAPEATTPPTTVGEGVPETGVRSMTAMVERTSVSGLSGTFGLVADEDGTIILRGEEAEFGYHAPSGATWSREGNDWVNEIDPIHGRRQLDSLLSLDLAAAVRYGGLGTAGERDDRPTIEATVELADNESAGWSDRVATVTIDDETGFVLDATVIDADGKVVEELRLTGIQWVEAPAGVSGAVGVDSDWTVTQGLPAAPVVGGRYLVPDGMDAVRTFTTEAAVPSGSEAENPLSDGAYVVDVTTGPWRHSKIIVFGRTAGEWKDPLAEEGWIFEGVVNPGTQPVIVAEPPLRPRAWLEVSPYDGGQEVVAVSGLVDPATANRLLDLTRQEGEPVPEFADNLPAITVAPDGAESAFAISGDDSGGLVVARRTAGDVAAETAWARATDEIWWEPASGVLGVEPLLLDTRDAHAVVLLDAFVDDDGEIAVIYGEVPSPGGLDGAETNVWLQRFGQPRSDAVALGWFAGIEHGVDAANRGGDRIAVSAGADLGEVFTFYDLAGNELDLPNNPVTVGHRYNEPPWYQHVSLAPDGRTLAFIEGPDWDSTTETTIGDWELVVVDLDSGDETARITLFERGTETVTHLDFDGTWAVVSRDDPIVNRAEPVTALAVNTATGTVSSLPDTAGIVTLADAE
jgi:hypothetical protein